MSDEFVFILLYIVLSAFLIYPPIEFISAGFTIPQLFSKYLGSEDESFIRYHLRKSVLNLIFYSMIPSGYIVLSLLIGYFPDVNSLFLSGTLFWKLFITTSLALPLLAIHIAHKWMSGNCINHPIAINLAKFSNDNNSQNWLSVANDINTEFRRIEKLIIQTNPLTKIIATEHWIMKITPLTILIAHQSDSSLSVKQSATYQTPTTTSPQHDSHIQQYLTIEIKSERRDVDTFTIRIKATDFVDLQDRIARSITIPTNVKFHKSIIDQFVDVFKATVALNERYETRQEPPDTCIGCLHARPNIKLRRLCDGGDGAGACTTCYCRPMWCIDCMAKWFASRQDNEQQSTWLSAKCSCPLCRATFCILDVCLLPRGRDDGDVAGE